MQQHFLNIIAIVKGKLELVSFHQYLTVPTSPSWQLPELSTEFINISNIPITVVTESMKTVLKGETL